MTTRRKRTVAALAATGTDLEPIILAHDPDPELPELTAALYGTASVVEALTAGVRWIVGSLVVVLPVVFFFAALRTANVQLASSMCGCSSCARPGRMTWACRVVSLIQLSMLIIASSFGSAAASRSAPGALSAGLPATVISACR